MQKNSDRANQPALPVMRGDNCDALNFLVVAFYELSMIFKSPNILPAVEFRSINQQSDFPMLIDERIDLRRDFAEVIGSQFLRHRYLQCIAGDDFGSFEF